MRAKITIALVLLFLGWNLFAYDELVKNESYFNKAIEKSKGSNFGENRIIAILDTGINQNSELKNKIIAEYDFTTNSPVAIDHNGHGTKIASIIAAANDGQGISGIAYNAKLIDAKVVDDNGNIQTENIIRAIEFAVKHGADVINMSFSSGEYSEKLQKIIEKYTKKGVIFVAAAGNNGDNKIVYPAGYDYVVAVGSLDRKTGKRAVYSNYGEWVDEWVEDGIWTFDGKKYSREYGTSEASAVVASILTNLHKKQKLIVEQNKKIGYKLFGYDTKKSNKVNNFNKKDYSFFNSIYYYLYAQTNLEYAFKIQKALEFQSLSSIYKKPTGKPLTDLINVPIEIWNNIDNLFKNIVKSATTYKTYEDNILINLYKAMFLKYIELKYREYELLDDTNYEKLINFLNAEKEKLDNFNDGDDFDKTLIIAQDTIDFLNENGYDIDPICNMLISKIRDIYSNINNMTEEFKYNEKLKDVFSKIIDILYEKKRTDRIIAFLQIERERFNAILSEYISKDNYFIKYINSNNFLNKLETNLKNEIALLVSESFQSLLTDLKEQALEKLKKHIIYRITVEHVLQLTEHNKDIIINKFNYDLLQSIINDLNVEKLGQNFKEIGYLTSKDLESFVTFSALIKMYNYYSAKLLISMAAYKPFKELIFGIPEEDIDTAKIIKITTDTYIIENEYYKSYYFNLSPNLSTLKKITLDNFDTFIDNNFVKDTPMQNTIDLIDATSTLVLKVSQKLSDSIIELITGNKPDPYTIGQSLEEYLNSINEFEIYNNIENINRVQKFAMMYAEIQSAYNLWLKAAINLYKSSNLLNLVAKQNIKKDLEISFYNDIYRLYKKSKSNLDDNIIQNSFIDKIVYSASSYILHHTKATRTFFYEQILKGLGLNPWVDRDFFKNLKENKIQIPIDLDFKPSNFNDNIYIIYSRYKKYTTVDNLDGDPVFYPTDNIYRGSAILAIMKIIEKEYKENEVYKNAYNYVEQSLSDFKKQNPNLCFSITICDFEEVKSDILKFLEQYKTRDGIALKDKFADDYKEIADYSASVSDVIRILTALEMTLNPKKQTEHFVNGDGKKLMLKSHLTQYQAILLKNRLLSFFKNNDVFFSEIVFKNDKVGEFADNYYQIEQFDFNYGPGSVVTTDPINSIPKVYINKKNKLKLKTKIPFNNKDRYLINWNIDKKYGHFISFKNINLNGYVINEIELEPKKDMVGKIIKLNVNILDTLKGEKASKSFYVRVVDDKIQSNSDVIVASTQFNVQYVSNNQFKINWQIKNAKSVRFEYSFDKQNWKKFDLINLLASSKTESIKTIDEAKNYEKIYFRADVLDKNGNHIYKIKELYYIPEKEYVEKATEIPVKTTIWGRQNGTTTSAKICWKKIIDSHYKLNVNYYELRYAKASTSDRTILKFNDNSDPNNLYSSNCRIIDGLEEDTTYYFQVRGCNNLDCGDWSDVEFVTIDIPHKPEFNTAYQYPKDGAKNVSKLTYFRWSASDKDGDELEFKVYWGETKDKLKYRSRGWTKNNFVELEEPLKPNTTYYWKVVVRSNGEIVESPIWSFTTANKGYDLTITDAKLISELKPDSEAIFKLTVKNIGDEKAINTFIKAYYKKGDKISEFRIGSSRIGKELNPGETIDVNVKVKFQDYIIKPNKYNGYKEYDNILVTGESYVIFDMPYLKYDGQDVNLENNKKELKIVYENKGAPKFQYFDIRFNGFSVFHPSDSYKNKGFFAIVGKELQIIADVIDDIRCDRAKIEYRTDEDDNWYLIREFKDNKDDRMNFSWIDDNGNYQGMSNGYDWVIPENLKNKNIQIRVTVYDDTGLKASKSSPYFPVYSNKLKLSNITFDKNEYNIGDVVVLSYDVDNDNEIYSFGGHLIAGSNQQSNVFKKIFKNGGQLSGVVSFKIPNNNRFANDNSYVKLWVSDIYGNRYEINSPYFKIQPNLKLNSIFGEAVRLFKKPAIPQNAAYKNQSAKLQFARIDDNDIVHTIVHYKEKYFIDNKSGDVPDELHYKEENYYISYDKESKTILKKIKLPEGKIVSLELNDNNIPYILIQRDRQLYYSYLDGDDFVKEKNILNPNVPEASINYISQVSNFDKIAYMNKSIYSNGYIYQIDGTYHHINRYKFSNGQLSNKEKLSLSGNVWLESNSYAKPVVIGDKIYSINDNTDKLIEVDLSNKNIKTYNLPYNLSDKDRGNYRYTGKFGLAKGNGKLYLFIKGEVYRLDNDLVKIGDIEYNFDGENVSLKNDWNEYVKRMFVVSGNNKIYLVLEHFGKSKKPENISKYDILEFEPNTGIFNKKVIEASFGSLGYTNSKSGFSSNGTIKDYIYYRGKLLVLSQYSSPFSSAKFYDTGLNMLDLETGDIIFLGALNIPATNLRFIKDKNGKLYIASENYNYKEKIYRLNINNIDIKLKYFRKPKIVRYKDKLLVTYEYGNIFDGRYSGYKTNYGYYYSVNRKSRLNKLKEIYPFISDEYTLYKEYLSCWNYENDFIYSSSKGAIYKTNDNGSVFEELHKESMYENGGGFSYNYSSLYLTAFLKYDNNISILDNDNHITSTTVKANGSRDIVYLFNEFLIHIGYEDGKYIIDKYYYDGNLSSIIFKNIDNNSLISLSSINNKAVGIFGWNEGEPYIAIADLSKDIIAPTVSFINNDAKVEVGKKITLKWSASDNDNKLAKIELYQTLNGSEKLIKTFDDTKINQYEVTIPNIQGVVSYKVKAYDLSGNVGSDIVTFNVFKPIVLNSFFVDKTTLNLGEKIVFTWLSNGDSQTKYTIYKKEINSNKWSVLFEVKGVNSKVYEVKDFVGSYQFKIVSGNQELVFPQTVKINGEWLIFNYDEFYPKGEFIKDGSSIRLKWSDNSKEILTYEVWVKTIDDDNFKKIAVTSNKFFDYVLNKDIMFRWKIAANYKNKYIESNEIEAKPTKLLAPQINSIELCKDSIRVSFTDVHNAKKYRIYRSTCNGIYKVIDEVETNYYQDYNIDDGICFSYKIVAIADNNIVSNFSNEKSINIGESEIYNVIIENENNSLINDNKIVLKYHPDRKVNFEKYEILIGINPKNMVTYLITGERNVTIENLSYNQTYYIEIYPLNINGKRLNIIPARLTFSTGFDNRKVTQKPIITVNEISNNYIVLSWNEVSNIDYYEIYRSEDGKSFEYIYKTNSTKFVDDINIESGKVYYYKIKALNSNSFSISDSVKVKTLENNNQECIQVITHAYNPQTGEEKDYASPCDVPEGWIIGNAPDNDGDGINDIKDTNDSNNGISEISENENTETSSTKKIILNLKIGWNLISIPIDKELDVYNYFFNSAKFVWKWDSNNKKWLGWSPYPKIINILEKYREKGILDTFNKIKPGEGFWVYSEVEEVLNFDGVSFNTLEQIDNLKSGWNLIGVGNLSIEELESFEKIKFIWKYSNGKWKLKGKNLDENIYKKYEKIEKLKSTDGVWVYIK